MPALGIGQYGGVGPALKVLVTVAVAVMLVVGKVVDVWVTIGAE